MMKFYHTFSFLMTLFTSCSANDQKNIVLCDPHQYLEMTTPGTIYCSITKPFHGVYWYDSSDSRTNHPVLSFEDNVKGGTAYQSGMFDVDSDGSLIINDVSLVHEHLFKVVVVYSDADSLEAVVRVSVQVKPYRDYPIIDQCGGEHPCLRDLQHAPVLTCRVQDSRPPVNLTWITRSIDGDSILNSESYYTFDGVTTTTIANITVDAKTVKVLALFICSAEYSYNILLKAESQIIIENRTYNPDDVRPNVLLVEMRTNQTLTCGGNDSQLFVWKRATSTTLFDTILFSTMGNSTLLLEGYKSVSSGGLALENISTRHEGVYVCTFGNGIRGGNQFYNLSVFAYPQWKDVLIANCDPLNERRCYIESGRQGKIGCGVRDIKPVVELKWILTSTSSSSGISLEPQTQLVHDNGETFDVFLETAYRIPKPDTRMSLTCKVAGSHGFFNFSKQVTILVEDDKENVQVIPTYAIVILAILVTLIILVVGAILIICYRQGREQSEQPKVNQQNEDDEENVPMIAQGTGQSEETEQLRTELAKELKKAYKNICDRWLLFPSCANGKVTMLDVFVENALHKNGLLSQPLNSYHEIFGKECSKRILLIGDPGMGKTTISLKAAYDWCKDNQNSPLKDTDLLILIRLRYIGGQMSLCEAIKTHLLPKDSKLEKDDIERILSSCTSLFILFDGFDEYAGESRSTVSDIFKIIKGSSFPGAHVITTTIPSFLPEETNTETTKIYASGFDDSTRSDYTSKVYDKGEILEGNIAQDVKENIYLKYLFNVPLFVSLLPHMKHNNVDVKAITSATHLFDTLLGRDSQMTQVESDSFANFYSYLHKEAFERLKNTNEQLSLVDDHTRNVAKDFYNRYVTIGVLIEDLNLAQSGHEIGTTGKLPGSVRFSHQLFQEWFAANHLVRLLKDTPEGVENQSLKGINPCRQPYLLRFASGLSKTAASRIIQYLINNEACRSLAILCAFEKDRNCTHLEDAIKKLCLKPLKFQKGDSDLLQQSMIELLNYASYKKIIVSAVEFLSSLATFRRISKIKSEYAETSLQTVRRITIDEPERELNTNEISTIINTLSCCQNVEILSFISKWTPKSIEKEDIACKLRELNLKVNWTTKDRETYFLLNHVTGRWETPGPTPPTPLTPEGGKQGFVWPTQTSIAEESS